LQTLLQVAAELHQLRAQGALKVLMRLVHLCGGRKYDRFIA
jgi:hypothetical protein